MCLQDSYHSIMHSTKLLSYRALFPNTSEDNDPQCNKKAAPEARNMLLLKLVHRLMFPIAEAIKVFQLDFVGSSIALQELQQLWTILEEYLYMLDRSSLFKSPLLDFTESMDKICDKELLKEKTRNRK